MVSEFSRTFLFATHLFSVLTGSSAATAMWAVVLLILAGLAAITKGGDLFTDSSVDVARITRIPPVIVGATVVSMATSFPEFMVSIMGTLSGTPDFAVGNVVGSCLCNIGLIIGVCAILQGFLAKKRGLTKGIVADRAMLKGPGMFMLATALITCVFSLTDSGGALSSGANAKYGLARWQAVVLLGGMFWYLGWSIRLAGKARQQTSEDEAGVDEQSQPTSWKVVAKVASTFILALIVVMLGSRLLIANGEALALYFGVPKLVLALTLFAIGTSLPELTISLIAVLKGHEALGIGNVIGSNVLNICWVLATCAVVEPLPISRQTVFVDLPVTLLLSGILLAFPWKKERISSRAGWCLLAVYVMHLGYVTVSNIP